MVIKLRNSAGVTVAASVVDVHDAAVQRLIGDQAASGLDLGKFRHLFVLLAQLIAVMRIRHLLAGEYGAGRDRLEERPLC
jgi:hypothetical protein